MAWGGLMPTLPTPSDVRDQLESLHAEQYSTIARRSATAWATPILVAAGDPLTTDPPALGAALFLLGAADLYGDFEKYVYGPGDFERARDELEAQIPNE